MKKLLSIVTVLALTLVLLAGCGKSGKKTVVVGAKDYTEQDVLGNMLSVLLEKNTDLTIEYKHEMSSNVVFAAIQSGDVDLYIDYTGTIYGSYLEHSEMKSADEVYDIAVKEMAERYNLRVLDSLGFNNTYTLAVAPEIAEQYGLKTYSDLAKVSDQLVFGGGFEILNRHDGLPNLKKMYNMSFQEEKAVEGVNRYQAVKQGHTQVTDAFATDGLLSDYGLVVLEDDKNFFPPYHAVTLIREETAEQYPEILTELEKLTGILSDDVMRDLNHQVDGLKKNPREVATQFLTDAGIIS